MVKKPKPPPIGIQDIFNAFHNSIRASVDTILQIDAEKLGDTNPKDFIFRYCSEPLGVLGVRLLEAEIRKEEVLHFFSLSERQREFIPAIAMRDLRASKRFEVIISARAFSFEFKMMFFYSKDDHTVSLQDVEIDEIQAVDSIPRFMSSIKSFEPLARTVIQGAAATVIIEGFKRVFSG